MGSHRRAASAGRFAVSPGGHVWWQSGYRSRFAGGIVYMCQIAGGAVGLGLNTAIVLSADTLRHGITIAFRVDAGLALAGFAVAAGFVGGPRMSPGHAAVPAAHHRVQAGPRRRRPGPDGHEIVTM